MTKRILQTVIVFLIITVQHVYSQEEKYIGLFLYNFTKFFDWPENAKTGDFVITVLGHESVAKELKQISGMKKVGSQNIVIKSISNPSEVERCQIMFVGFWHSRYLPQIMEKLQNEPCLIVTEKEGLLKQGAAINFLVLENTIKFEMKKSNAVKQGLKIDQRIMELAMKVED